MAESVHTDVLAVLEVHRRRDQKGVGGYFVEGRGVFLGEKARQHILDTVGQRVSDRRLPVEQVVKHLGDKLVLIVVLHDVVAALTQVGAKVAGGGLQHRDDLGTLRSLVAFSY